MCQVFFEQMEPKVKKGRAWTFHRLNTVCDTQDGVRVQAVLYPPNDGRPVRFRTFEKALTTLADVTHLDPEIVVDLSNWRAEVGPH